MINKLERRFGHLGIPNLMRYMIALNILGSLLGIVNSSLYTSYLMLDFQAVFHGQIWRLVTFMLYPSLSIGSGTIINLIFYAIMLYLYYFIGNTLERVWGTFRFNLYYFSGIFLTVLATLIYYLIFGVSFGVQGFAIEPANLDYLNQAMFLTFAFLFPDTQFLFQFVIPIKAKWLGLVYLGLSVFELVSSLMRANYYPAVLIAAALINFVFYYFQGRNPQGVKVTVKQRKRKREYQRKSREPSGPRHRCAICGRTEQDDPRLEFRYCSKCEGNYEYCSDHLFTHTHVHK